MSQADDRRRIHGIDAAGPGDVGGIDDQLPFGTCPSCGADLGVASVKNPITGRIERGITHTVPFCTYYGETDPDDLVRAVVRARKEN